MLQKSSKERQLNYWEAEHGFRLYDHPVVRAFARQRVNLISGWIDASEISSALDVGCGDGFSSYYMRELIPEVWGTDISEAMIGRNPLLKDGKVMRADICSMPFADDSFDLVYGWEVLHHIEDPKVAVAEMARISRRYVLVAEPNRNNLFQSAFALFDREHRWVLRYNLSYMCSLFNSSGLEVILARSGGWIFPNKSPAWLLPLLGLIPYGSRLGITNWVLGRKADASEGEYS